MSHHNSSTASLPHPSEKLSFWKKTAYAIGGLGNAIGPGTIIPFWYTFFLTDIARLDLGLVSLFWGIVTVWDAVNNPIVGYISDHTRTRWGRRRPYLLFGAVPFGVFFMLLWWIPPTNSQSALFTYFLVIYLLFETTATAVSAPYAALMPELTHNHDERTSLVMYQMVVTILAGILTPILFGLVVLPMFPERDPRAYQYLAIVSGSIFIITLLIAFLNIREHGEYQIKQAPSVQESARFMLRNISFRYALGIYILGWMPITVVMALFSYYFIYWIGMSADEVSLVQGGIMLMAWLFLPLVLWMSRRFEKKTAYIYAVGSWALLLLSTLLIPQGTKTLAYLICALSGLGISAIHVLPSSMMPDVIEAGELASGYRQEGAYFGVTAFFSKIGTMAVLTLLPGLLQLIGYVQPSAENPLPVQPSTALDALRLMIAVLPAFLLLISMIVAWYYPITRERHAEIRTELEKKRSINSNP